MIVTWAIVSTVLGALVVLYAFSEVFLTVAHPHSRGRLTRAVVAAIWRATGPLGRHARAASGPLAAVAVILLIIAIRMIFASGGEIYAAGTGREPFIFPLAVPLLAGPSAMATVLFFGGWLPPFPNLLAPLWTSPLLAWIPPPFWFLAKVAAFIFFYIWFRGTFPRYRFDQLMRLGWKVLLPVSLANLMLVALGVLLAGGPR